MLYFAFVVVVVCILFWLLFIFVRDEHGYFSHQFLFLNVFALRNFVFFFSRCCVYPGSPSTLTDLCAELGQLQHRKNYEMERGRIQIEIDKCNTKPQ